MPIFRTPGDLADHFKWHRYSFPAVATEAEYEEAALEFLTKPRTASMLEFVRPIGSRKGDIIRYDQSTHEYGTVSFDGFVRTYFKPTPNDGTWPNGRRDMHGFPTNLAYYHWDCRKAR